jgi:CTP-dependent riboflavin kinase
MPEQRDLSGTIQSGQGLGAGLMADPVVVEKLEELTGFPVVPGTLNVRLPRPLERGPNWRYLPADEITSDWEARTGSR